ncbi:MAG: ABC transporter permease [Blastocatellia bacterium]|nr:ABC transporter permease [Blastocatellia bacterium]
MLSKLRTALRALLRRSEAESELDEELRYHIEQQTEQNIRLGMNPEEARFAARKAFGGVEQAKERSRDARGLKWLEELWQDMRYGARVLMKRPGFTLIAVLTLGLGIGVNTALFTLFNTLIRPLLIKDPDAVVRLDYVGDKSSKFSFHDYLHLQNQTKVFSALVASSDEKFQFSVEETEEPQVITGVFASGNFFSELGGEAILGRTFAPEESVTPGKDQVVVLSHRFWRRRFAGDPQIVGRTILLRGKPFTVIGVAEPDFAGLSTMTPELWLPMTMKPEMPPVWGIPPAKEDWFDKRSLQWLSVVGRLKPGKTLEEARAELAVLFGQLERAYPEIDRGDSVRVSRMSGFGKIGRSQWRTFGTFLIATGIVLLIACSNLANLLLARAVARRREIGVRLCLGASRWRVIRQLMTESLLLALMGGVAGLLLAWWSLETGAATVVVRIAEPVQNLTPDARILAFTFLLSFLSGAAFGLAPALQATRADLVSAIKDEGAAFGQRLSRSWLRNGLVIAQVALSLLLLVPAGLLLRGMAQILMTDPGFETKKALVVGYGLQSSGYDQARAQTFNQQLRARLAALPGVESVSVGDRPLGGSRLTITALGKESADGLTMRASYLEVEPDWFKVFGVPIVRGRDFTAEETQSAMEAVIVSETTARTLWPGDEPIGKSLRVEKRVNESNENIFLTVRVIGVARDAQTGRIGEIPPLSLYLPRQSRQWLENGFLARTSRDAVEMKAAIRAEARALDPSLQIWLYSMEEIIAEDSRIKNISSAAGLATGLGLLALLLAAIGVYGVMAYAVSERNREIGIRMALGANRRDALRLILGQGLWLVTFGAALGGAGGAAISRLFSSFLYGLSPFDPIAYLLVALLLMAVAVVACLIPARRATKVDPSVALRGE